MPSHHAICLIHEIRHIFWKGSKYICYHGCVLSNTLIIQIYEYFKVPYLESWCQIGFCAASPLWDFHFKSTPLHIFSITTISIFPASCLFPRPQHTRLLFSLSTTHDEITGQPGELPAITCSLSLKTDLWLCNGNKIYQHLLSFLSTELEQVTKSFLVEERYHFILYSRYHGH